MCKNAGKIDSQIRESIQLLGYSAPNFPKKVSRELCCGLTQTPAILLKISESAPSLAVMKNFRIRC